MPRRDPRLADIPQSVNDEIADRAIRHLLFLTRLQTLEARKIVALFDKRVIPDVLDQIERRVARIAERGFDTGPATTARLERLAVALDRITTGFANRATRESAKSLLELAKSEVGFEAGVLEKTIPVTIDLELPSVGLLRASIETRPFEGRVLNEWWQQLGRNTRNGILQQVKIGLVEGEPTTAIARRLRERAFVTARAHAQTVAHTAVIHTSNQARMDLYRANKDIVRALRFTATLDDRTCPACGSLDGQVFDVDNATVPPIHGNCRCVLTPVTRSFREMGIDLDELPPGTRASMNGQVPDDLTYNQWLKKQPVDIQNEALGPRRAQLFRKGDLPISKFVNRRNRVLTLKEIEAREGDVFRRVFG